MNQKTVTSAQQQRRKQHQRIKFADAVHCIVYRDIGWSTLQQRIEERASCTSAVAYNNNSSAARNKVSEMRKRMNGISVTIAHVIMIDDAIVML
jgi:metal-responsive CopG/Arc/MetJ family transcriptional regulator